MFHEHINRLDLNNEQLDEAIRRLTRIADELTGPEDQMPENVGPLSNAEVPSIHNNLKGRILRQENSLRELNRIVARLATSIVGEETGVVGGTKGLSRG